MGRIASRFTVVAAAVLATGGLATASPALADVVACGQTITTSIRVSNDIGPCFNAGLVIAANNITVDLGGHTIRGGGNGPQSAIDEVGIRFLNVTGSTVRNGTVRDFYAGVLVKGGSRNTVTHITATHNVGDGSSVYGDGIVTDASSDNLITSNVVTQNGYYTGINMIHSSMRNTISFNQVADNNFLSPGEFQQTSGIGNDTGSGFNIVDHNSVQRNGQFGISLAGQDTNHDRATNNIIRDNGNWGINAGGDGHFVSANVLDHNGYEQFRGPISPPDINSDGGVVTCGTCFGPGDFTTIQNNIITNNNGRGIAMLFNGNQFQGGTGRFGTFPPSPYEAPRSNLVQRNQVRANTGDGIFVECETLYDASFDSSCLADTPPHQGIRILKNTSFGNGGAGAGRTAWDLHDGNVNCDHNIWSGNQAGTANPPCTRNP